MDSNVITRYSSVRLSANQQKRKPDAPQLRNNNGTVPDIRLLITGVILGILVMLILFLSSGVIQDMLIALGIGAEVAILHCLSGSQA